MARLYAAYEQARRDRQLIDFESVLELTAAILLTEPAAAREVHAAFRFFVVDEFQDINPLQKLLLDAWLGDRAELCVVGDPRQTIYSFTGATAEYLQEVRGRLRRRVRHSPGPRLPLHPAGRGPRQPAHEQQARYTRLSIEPAPGGTGGYSARPSGRQQR